MRQGFVTLNFARCSMVDRHRHRHRHRGRGRFLHTPKRCRMGIYDTYVHSYLIWNWVITSPITIMGERSFQWIQRRTRDGQHWFFYFFYLHMPTYLLYITICLHTHTYTHMESQQTFCIYEQHQWKLIIIIGISIIEPVGRRVRPHVRGRRPRAMILMLFTMLKTTTTTTMTTRRAGCVAKGVKLYDLQWPLRLQDLHASGSTHTYTHECVCVLWMWLHR